MVIIISGVVFMHKEVTSTGEIITHIHPYNFTKKRKANKSTINPTMRYNTSMSYFKALTSTRILLFLNSLYLHLNFMLVTHN